MNLIGRLSEMLLATNQKFWTTFNSEVLNLNLVTLKIYANEINLLRKTKFILYSWLTYGNRIYERTIKIRDNKTKGNEIQKKHNISYPSNPA